MVCQTLLLSHLASSNLVKSKHSGRNRSQVTQKLMVGRMQSLLISQMQQCLAAYLQRTVSKVCWSAHLPSDGHQHTTMQLQISHAIVVLPDRLYA